MFKYDELEVSHVSAKDGVHDELDQNVVGVPHPGPKEGVNNHSGEGNVVNPDEGSEGVTGVFLAGDVVSVGDVGGHGDHPEESPHRSVNPDGGNQPSGAGGGVDHGNLHVLVFCDSILNGVVLMESHE